MSSFDAAMEKAEAMLYNAQEALRDLPEVSGMLDTADLTDGQRQAIRRRLEPIKKVQVILEQAGVIEDPGGPRWRTESPERAALRWRLESEGPGGPDWEQPPNRADAGGVGSEGGGGSRW
jgi:hypothetical protein